MSKRSKNRKAKAQARRSQKQRERKVKRSAKNKRQTQSALEINLRHRKRIAAQHPRAWEHENPVDVAVFDQEVLGTLDPELQSQVLAVRGALELISNSDGERALERVSVIPRKSPLSQWRLLIRGLDRWLANDFEAAHVAWARLDGDRRPARIAQVLSASEDEEISSKVAVPAEPPQNPHIEVAELDSAQLNAAKLVRRIRFDRAAIRIAFAMVSQENPEDMPEDAVISPEMIQSILEFSRNFETTEPRLVSAIQQHAIQLGYSQPYMDIFRSVRHSFAGPDHDPDHFLLAFFYFVACNDDEEASRALKKYIAQLPKNDRLSKPLRNALLSQSYLNEANSEVNQPLPMFFWGSKVPDLQEIDSLFKKSTAAYPLNREAHKAHADWLKSEVENERADKEQRKKATDKIPDVMRRWAKAIDDAPEPRLWLVDYLLESEQLEEAETHVQWLASSRHDDPRVRATPWKWRIIEAMRLCRRKNRLSQVPAMLDEADRSWPTWLNRDWLGYLQAAFHLRNGDTTSYEQTRIRICRDLNRTMDSPVDACMMLGAAQRMRVPAGELKPLRIPVDGAVKQIKRLAQNDLFELGSFFWDLHRMGLNYPAQRMHASKFGKELLARFKASEKLYDQHRNDPKFLDTLLWCSESRFWSDGYQLKMPGQFMLLAKTEPVFAGAFLNTQLSLRYQRDFEDYQWQIDLVAETAKTEPDPFYRFWFRTLVERAEESISKNRRSFSRSFESFANMFGGFDCDDDDDDEYDYDYDDECDCPDCVAQRARESARSAGTGKVGGGDASTEQFEFDFSD